MYYNFFLPILILIKKINNGKSVLTNSKHDTAGSALSDIFSYKSHSHLLHIPIPVILAKTVWRVNMEGKRIGGRFYTDEELMFNRNDDGLEDVNDIIDTFDAQIPNDTEVFFEDVVDVY